VENKTTSKKKAKRGHLISLDGGGLGGRTPSLGEERAGGSTEERGGGRNLCSRGTSIDTLEPTERRGGGATFREGKGIHKGA